MHQKFPRLGWAFILVFHTSIFALSSSAQVRSSELAGKYHLTAKPEIWAPQYEGHVTPHDDFTFTLSAQADGSFTLSSFFYSGMDENWTPLTYSATATFNAQEQLLYVYSTEWMWDDYMDTFMDPYRKNAGDPMIYFMVKKDAGGRITLSTLENCVGFYYLTNQQWEYAIDYPGALVAEKVETYASVTAATLPGDYTLSCYDMDGRQQTYDVKISARGSQYFISGLLGDSREHEVLFDADGCGLHIEQAVDINDKGYYCYYLGSIVGECGIGFHFDKEGRLVADNYFCYTPDFVTWYDAFGGVLEKAGTSSISQVPSRSGQSDGSLSKNFPHWGEDADGDASVGYDLQGKAAGNRGGIVVSRHGKVLKK